MARPLQVYVDDADLERLEAWSKKRGWTKSQAVRAALRALTREDAGDPLLSASGMIAGLPPDLSTKIDRAIEETFIATPASQAKKTRPRRGLR
ncbi:MAG TPA: ribbon-helix-helix protein, CopG family [Polyangiales bacterium]|nr:ribbon-helix-helix protein, CopG family [Polyangiales bacterium]